MKINLSNPCFIWVLSWGITIALMSLQLTSNIVELNESTVYLVLTNIISALVLWAFTTPINNKRTHINYLSIDLVEMNRFLKYLLIAWAFGSVVDILYSGGLPIMWAALGTGKDYTNFGIPSFHGIINACYLLSVTILGVNIFYEKKERKLFLFFLLCWPILMLGRGILLSALVQIGAVYLILNAVNVKKFFGLLAILLISVVIFGVVGDYRGSGNPFEYLITDDFGSQLFNALPNGFLWFYVYITTGLNNIAFSIDTISPTYTPYYSIINLLPSFLRSNIDNYVLNASLVELVDDNLNTSSFYSGYLSDFGLIGSAIAGVLLQALAIIFYRVARNGNVAGLLGYAILFECVVFSIFYDMFLLLPYLFQILLTFYLMHRCKIVKNRKTSYA